MPEEQANRELDARVAEMMGRQTERRRIVVTGKDGQNFWRTSLCFVGDGGVPKYSTDPAAAWEVVEKVTGEHADEFAVALMKQLGIPLRDRAPYEAVSDVMSRLTPVAICLAALGAVSNDPT